MDVQSTCPTHGLPLIFTDYEWEDSGGNHRSDPVWECPDDDCDYEEAG